MAVPGGELAVRALEGLEEGGAVARLVRPPVVQVGGAVRAQVALHRPLAALGRGETEMLEHWMKLVNFYFAEVLSYLHCDIGVVVEHVLLPLVLHGFVF